MVKIYGTYQLVRTQNVEGFLKFLGLEVNDDLISMYTDSNMTLRIYVLNQVYTLTTTIQSQNHLLKFTLGKSFDEVLPNGSRFTTTVTKETDRLIFWSRSETGGTAQRIFQFSSDGFEMIVEGTEIKQVFRRIEKQREMHLPW